jgi:hypothetical protein
MKTFDANKPLRYLIPVTDDEGLIHLSHGILKVAAVRPNKPHRIEGPANPALDMTGMMF